MTPNALLSDYRFHTQSTPCSSRPVINFSRPLTNFVPITGTHSRGSSMDDRTLVTFSDNPASQLEAYADSGEGIDRAGGFAVQVSQANGVTGSGR